MNEEMIAQMRSLAPEAKAVMRRGVRRQLSDAQRTACKPHTPEEHAFLSGYLSWARRALEALS